MKLCVRAFMLLLLTGFARFGQCQEMVLHDGDRVVFYGDSITAQRLYTRLIEDIVLTRYPQLHINFWNAGVPGDTVYGGYTGDMTARVNRDVLPHRPTHITIMLGMNDGYYMPFNEKYLKLFEDGYQALLATIRTGAPRATITLITPTPYDERTHGTEFAHYNEVVSRHAEFVRQLAASSHLGMGDFNQAETALLNAELQKEPALAQLLVPDRIHPGDASHWVMAAELAKTWGFSPTVSTVEIDASQGKSTHLANARVDDLQSSEGKLIWTQTDNALPLPLQLDDEMIQAVRNVSDLASMDQEILRIKNLMAPKYVLQIDGKKIASLDREQLAAGVNLALYNTPMESQAKEVDGIELKRTRLDEVHFIMAIENPKTEGIADATRALSATDEQLARQQHEAAQPKPHRFELIPE